MQKEVQAILIKHPEGVIISRQSDGVFPAVQDGDWKHRESSYLQKNHLYILWKDATYRGVAKEGDIIFDTEINECIGASFGSLTGMQGRYFTIIGTTDTRYPHISRLSPEFLKAYVSNQRRGIVMCEMNLDKECWECHNFGDPWGDEHYNEPATSPAGFLMVLIVDNPEEKQVDTVRSDIKPVDMTEDQFIETIKSIMPDASITEDTWRYVWRNRDNPDAFKGDGNNPLMGRGMPPEKQPKFTEDDMYECWINHRPSMTPRETFKSWLTRYKAKKQ